MKTRALVPALSLGLTTLLCCAETAVVKQAPSAESRGVRKTPPAPEIPTENVAPPPAAEVPIAPPVKPIDLGPPAVRVRLDQARNGALEFGLKSAYRIYAGALDDPDAEGRTPIASGANLRSALADSFGSTVRVNGFDLKQREVTILPDDPESLRVGKRRYAGGLILRGNGTEITAINLVTLEDYVLGVLYAEMPERFANEALRAQAVVSRSFALYHAQQGHELRDDQGSQVYVGLELSDDTARRIVESTLGEVLTWNGAPFEAYFHSTCGGRTASARSVFGIQAPPPLCQSVVCDSCTSSPHFSWTRTLPRTDIDRFYKGAFGSNLRINIADRDEGGRALHFDIIANDGKSVDRPVADRFRNDFNYGRALSKQLLSAWLTDVRVDKKNVTVSGRGFGHGVGLCQYGAGGLAARGRDYRSILNLYFPGAQITRLYD